MTENAQHRAPDRQGKGVPAPWDYYYLRYFVGAIVGAGLLVALWVADPRVLPSFPHTFPLAPRQGLDLAAVIAALGTAGLAYCYIASAPILLMHGFRFRFSAEERWWSWWLLRVTPIVAVALLIVFFWCCGAIEPSSFRSRRLGLLLYVPYGLSVLFQLVGLLSGRLDTVRGLYVDLARHRASHEQWVGGYTESYRHLREHGNAFLIILMEVVLAAALYAADTTIRFFTIAVIWIVPATFSWFLGTWLEFGIVAGKTSPRSVEKTSSAGPIRRWICEWIRSRCADGKGASDHR